MEVVLPVQQQYKDGIGRGLCYSERQRLCFSRGLQLKFFNKVLE